MAKTYIDENGYRRFWDSGKLVSHWVAEQSLGRPLKKHEVVHHKNRNKLDNSWDNLWVCKNQAENDRIHEFDRIRFGARASYQGFRYRLY